jgi:hypothetical protein
VITNHCSSRHFKFKTYNCSSIYQRYQPLYLPNIICLALCFFELFLNLRGKIKNILYYTRFISHFVALVCFVALVALKNVCDEMVSYKTRIINYYFILRARSECFLCMKRSFWPSVMETLQIRTVHVT